MLHILDAIRQMTVAAVAIRMIVAGVCGGLVGLERERRGYSAGVRTHILICVGASMATMTSQFLALVMNYYTDISRLGAQVVAGIGFIGAGTIIVTKRSRVKGLTTAAGLWACAIIGLAAGAGYIEAAVLVCVLMLLVETVLLKVEQGVYRRHRHFIIYIQYTDNATLDRVVAHIRKHGGAVDGLSISRIRCEAPMRGAMITMHTLKRREREGLIDGIKNMDGVMEFEMF